MKSILLMTFMMGAGESSSIGFFTQGWEGTKRQRLAAFEEQKRREFNP